jgi:hypothetical protein
MAVLATVYELVVGVGWEHVSSKLLVTTMLGIWLMSVGPWGLRRRNVDLENFDFENVNLVNSKF